jgi:hypothetical protein
MKDKRKGTGHKRKGGTGHKKQGSGDKLWSQLTLLITNIELVRKKFY